jgi:predicted nucleic acid-binding protein
MRVFVDTNVVLDVLCDRQPFAGPARVLLTKIESGDVHASLSATTFTTIFYIARKQLGTDAAREAAVNLLRLFEICPVDREVLETALHGPFKDLEDGVQDAVAATAAISIIITRNGRDFACSERTILDPESFLAQHGTSSHSP